MSYIGRTPEVGNYRKADSISVVNGQATYNLTVNGEAVNPNANQVICSLNGVIQSSNDSFSIANNQITFASNLQTGDVIDFILILGDTLDVGTPSDNTVGITQLNVSDGTNGQALTTNGSGTLSFSTISGTTINNNADNRVITGSGTANTLEAEANLTFDGSLNISTDDPNIKMTDTNTNSYSQLTNTNGTITIEADKGNGSGSSEIRFTVDNSQKAVIDSSGDLKINSTLAGLNSKVLIGFGATQRGMMLYDYNNGSGTTFIQFRNGSSAGTNLGEITRNGSNNSINYNTTSDYRLKTNIEDKIDGIEKVKQLNVKKFNWLNNIDVDKVDGFLAHEVSSVVPEAISGEKDAVDEEGNIIPQGIDQSKLVPLLTSALQEAITKIETLEAKVEALENA